MILDNRIMKTAKAAFSKSVSCTSITLNSILHPMSLFGGGGLNLSVCQFDDWMFYVQKSCITRGVFSESLLHSRFLLFAFLICMSMFDVKCLLWPKSAQKVLQWFSLFLKGQILAIIRRAIAVEQWCSTLFVPRPSIAIHYHPKTAI